MIYVLYSGDYELFMGGNYLPEHKVLIEPTNKALDTFESVGIPVTLFADLLCLWRYRACGFHDFPDQADSQLCKVIQRGHDVQMHLHCHWPNTRIERHGDGSSQYHYDRTTIFPGPHLGDIYRFTLQQLQEGKKYLHRLLRSAENYYQCIAYRAGAYGLQPAEGQILAALQDAGYKIDSSIVPGYPGLTTPKSPVDFRAVPNLGNYRLSKDTGINTPAPEGIFEIPIAAAVMHSIGPLVRRKAGALVRRMFPRPKAHADIGYTVNETHRDNSPVHHRPAQPIRMTTLIKRSFSMSHWGMLHIDDPSAMLDVTKCYVRRYHNDSSNLFFSVLFHPKDFVPARHNALRKYHAMLKKTYGDNIRAITFREAAGLIPPPLQQQRNSMQSHR